MTSNELRGSRRRESPISASGDGYVFEHTVQAFFVLQMMMGGLVPRMDGCEITEVILQSRKYGRNTDDCEVVFRDKNTGKNRRLLVQIKRSFNLQPSNKAFTKTIEDAWGDFTSPSFNKSCDRIALVTGDLDTCGTGLKRMLTHIQSTHQQADQFWRDHISGYTDRSTPELQGLKRLQEKIKLANDGNDPSKETEFNFFKSFFIIKSDMHESLFQDGDLNIALIHSMLARKRWKGDAEPWKIWELLLSFISARNKDQIIIRKDNPPDHLKKIFEEELVVRQRDITDAGKKMSPECGSKTLTINGKIQTTYKKELALLCLIGEFDASRPGDQDMVAKLLESDYQTALNAIQSIANTDASALKLRGTIWKVVDTKKTLEQIGSYIYDNHVDSFAQIYLRILGEIDPALELDAKERYFAEVYDKKRIYSNEIRSGVANGMAMLANSQDLCSNCSIKKLCNIAKSAVRELLSKNQDSKMWMSIMDDISSVAQTAPTEFLSKLETALDMRDDNPIIEVINESNGSPFFRKDYISGLYGALAELLWDKDLFFRTSMILARISDQIGSYGEGQRCALDVILHTILPWQPKTFASVDVQHSVVEKIVKEYRGTGLELLKRLLPGVTYTTVERQTPMWLNVLRDRGNGCVIKPVERQELEEQNLYYSNMYVDAVDSLDEIIGIIKDVNHLAENTFARLIVKLRKKMASASAKEKRVVWEALLKEINELNQLNQYIDAENPRAVKLRKIADTIEPKDNLEKSLYLFSNYDYDLINYNDSKKGLEEVEKKRRGVLLDIFGGRDLNKLSQLVNKVTLPHVVGTTLGCVNSPHFNERMILPAFLDGNKAEQEFAKSFIVARYVHCGVNWIKKLNLSSWAKEERLMFILSLPFNQDAWSILETQRDSALNKKYWRLVDNFRHTKDDDDIEYAIKNLLIAKRPLATIEYICWLLMQYGGSNKERISTDQCLNVLIKSLNTSEDVSRFNRLQYEIKEVFTYLYCNSDYTETDLWRAELGYLEIFHKNDDIRPLALTYKIANDPDFFCELIQTAYKSNIPESKVPSKINESLQFKLLRILSFNDFPIMPGTDERGELNDKKLRAWIDRSEGICKKSGHLDIAQSVIGGYLANSPPDQSGLWINRTVADILERDGASSMRSGYNTGIYNACGVQIVDIAERSEETLQGKWLNRARKVEELGLIRFATSLRKLVDDFKYDCV
ncbi:hypothetical protein HG443_002105 [Candidatus Saccharibacteria bacterium]|nr:hypothetical protein [Candidatus Saccharibacteria bacterium]